MFCSFSRDVFCPGVLPCVVVMMVTDQNEAIRARMSADFHATQRVDNLTGEG